MYHRCSYVPISGIIKTADGDVYGLVEFVQVLRYRGVLQFWEVNTVKCGEFVAFPVTAQFAVL